MARWVGAQKILKEMVVLEGGHVRRDDLSSLLPGNTNPRQKWINAMKRGGEGAQPVPTSIVEGAAVVHGSNILEAIYRLLGRKYSEFLHECEADTRELLMRCSVPVETIDAAMLTSRPVAPAIQGAVPYRYENGSFYLNGNAVPMLFFGDSAEEPWFKAKAIHDFLGTKNIGQAMSRVHVDDKAKLQNLIGDKGNPIAAMDARPSNPSNSRHSRASPESQDSIIVPTDHGDLGAWYVNWSGFDSILRGSTSPVAKGLHYWSLVVMFQQLLQNRVTAHSEADRPPTFQTSVVDDLTGVAESDLHLVYLFPRPSSSDGRTLVKLGKSSDVGMRRTQLVQDFPNHWILVGAVFTRCGELEAEVHRSFAEFRVPTLRWHDGQVTGQSQEVYDLGWCGDAQAVVRRVWARLEELRANSKNRYLRCDLDASSSSLLVEVERTKQAEAQARKAEADASKAEAETRYLEALRKILDRATPQEVLQLTSAQRV
jgi:prophage antirepressor-like protein